ncbi:MAG: T9SS type A sorting domain-containing protein [Bacteroidetes bacterium]|nr:T9SS type A sorting domain-containing protein [Bacteroidota bacterium]MCW5897158.1 T9SS type A sorting domain-containing protein [Bacteroidota bacterium]
MSWAPLSVCWSKTYGDYRVVVSRGFGFRNDSLQLEAIETLSPNQAQGINSSPAVNNTPIPITTQSTPLMWHIAGTWRTNSPTLGDGIAVSSWGGMVTSTFNPPSLTTYFNPDISPGVWSYPYVRIWVAWEGVTNNSWKLYGSVFTVMITDVQEGEAKPAAYALYQNYPNPFNPMTTIRYQLPAAGHVTLKVFDLLGREVATLVDGIQQAGFKSVAFDGGGLPSGIYFYRLNNGNYSAVKKMVLIQ